MPIDKVKEKLLENLEFSSRYEIKEFISKVQSRITACEKLLYEQDKVDTQNLKRIKVWRSKLLNILKINKNLPGIENKEEKGALETLKLLNKQVDLADTN